MAQKYEFDKLEDIPEGMRERYIEKNGKYVLDLDGGPDVSALERKRTELLDETKAERKMRLDLERQLAQRDEADAIKNKEFEKLAESYKGQASKTAEQLAALQRKVADAALNAEAANIAASLTRDAVRAKLLQKEALASLEYSEDGGVKIVDGRTAEQLAADLKKAYPFLADGNPATGGGASGSGSTSGGAAKKFNEYTGQELAQIRKTDPAQYDRLKSDFYAPKG
jgi:hypothetical protein